MYGVLGSLNCGNKGGTGYLIPMLLICFLFFVSLSMSV